MGNPFPRSESALAYRGRRLRPGPVRHGRAEPDVQAGESEREHHRPRPAQATRGNGAENRRRVVTMTIRVAKLT